MTESGQPKTTSDYIHEIALWLADEYSKAKIKGREYTYEYGYSFETLEKMYQDQPVELDRATDELRNKMTAVNTLNKVGVIEGASEDVKEFDDGTEIEVVHLILDEDALVEYVAKINSQSSPEEVVVVISSSGIGVRGQAERHYGIKGARKAVVLEMFTLKPEGLSAKAWARLTGKSVASASQAVNSDMKSINAIFRKNLQLDNDLIVHRGGYTLNFEELDIRLEE